MLNSFRSNVPEQKKDAATSDAEIERSFVGHFVPKSERTTESRADSCIGSGMSVVGKVDCNGPVQIYGRIEGEVSASDLVIGTGAQIEGSVVAQSVTICGRVEGTIRAVRVKLQNGGAVAGDIFHRSLSIDEDSLFEGSSRRVENPTDPSSTQCQRTKDIRSPSQSPPIDADVQRVESALTEWSESTVVPRQ